MWQQLITYLIVALSAAWLVWHLFLPAALRQRLRPGKPVAQGCGSGGCNDCATGCGTIEKTVKIRLASPSSNRT